MLILVARTASVASKQAETALVRGHPKDDEKPLPWGLNDLAKVYGPYKCPYTILGSEHDMVYGRNLMGAFAPEGLCKK